MLLLHHLLALLTLKVFHSYDRLPPHLLSPPFHRTTALTSMCWHRRSSYKRKHPLPGVPVLCYTELTAAADCLWQLPPERRVPDRPGFTFYPNSTPLCRPWQAPPGRQARTLAPCLLSLDPACASSPRHLPCTLDPPIGARREAWSPVCAPLAERSDLPSLADRQGQHSSPRSLSRAARLVPSPGRRATLDRRHRRRAGPPVGGRQVDDEPATCGTRPPARNRQPSGRTSARAAVTLWDL